MINESLVAKQGTLATIETPPQMLVGKLRHLTPTGGTFQETLFYQERFIDFLYRAGIFAQSGGNGGQSHRAAFELVNDGAEYLIIYLIQTVFVDIQGFEGKLCDFRIDTPRTFHLGKIAYTPQQCIGNTRCATAAARNLGGSPYGARHIEDAGRTTDNAAQHIIIVIFPDAG